MWTPPNVPRRPPERAAVMQRTARPSALPVGCLPRGFDRVQAAEYIGVGVTKFDEMVEDGRMPKPKCINARKVWDRMALDAAFLSLPEEQEANPWDEVV